MRKLTSIFALVITVLTISACSVQAPLGQQASSRHYATDTEFGAD
jgi:hypothetical protein